MAGVEALHLGPHAGALHGLEEELDVMKRVGENVIVIERLALLGVDRVVHRAHVQGRHLRPEMAALNMGSMNYAIYSEKRKAFYHDHVFANPFHDIQFFLEAM